MGLGEQLNSSTPGILTESQNHFNVYKYRVCGGFCNRLLYVKKILEKTKRTVKVWKLRNIHTHTQILIVVFYDLVKPLSIYIYIEKEKTWQHTLFLFLGIVLKSFMLYCVEVILMWSYSEFFFMQYIQYSPTNMILTLKWLWDSMRINWDNRGKIEASTLEFHGFPSRHCITVGGTWWAVKSFNSRDSNRISQPLQRKYRVCGDSVIDSQSMKDPTET